MSKLEYFKKPKIGARCLVWFLLIALLPLAMVTYLNYRNSEETVREEVTDTLLAIAERQTNQINTYLRERERSVTTLSRMPGIIDAMERFNKAFKEGGAESTEYAAIDKELRPFLTYYQESSGYDDLFLLSPEGDVIFSVKMGEDFG